MPFWRSLSLVVSMLLCGWQATAAGNDTVNQAILDAVADGRLSGLHSVLVLHNGEVFAEAYSPGADQAWGDDLGEVQHGPDTLHDLRSVTKSVVGLLYGIALADGKVPPPSASLYAQFPEYADLGQDPAKQRITVADALTMRMGLAWDERSISYRNRRNGEIAMEWAKDRYRYVLQQAVVEPPGAVWRYSGGASTLIGRLIEKGTGMRLDAYAEAKLFAPLGISAFQWTGRGNKEPSAASGLRISAHGLARIGEMIVAGGRWHGQQIVPVTWLEELQTPKADLAGGLRYSYHWYLPGRADPARWMAGFGNGGQRLTVQPKQGLVYVIFTGNYDKPDAWKVPNSVILDFIVPALRQKLGR